MKRYNPSDEERERIDRAQRMLGIPAGTDDSPVSQPHVDAEAGVTRITIAAWRELWRNDRPQWLREIRDRPHRFDRDGWRRAVVKWWNQIPADSDERQEQEQEQPGRRDALQGVPILVKDLFDVVGEETRCGSAVLGAGGSDGGPPVPAADQDAWLVSLFRRQGASLQGRTAMNEFAYGIDGRNRTTGDCPHPLDATRISGGSSSGSAWAVAAGIVPVALGSDTGGSIRVPAALCGIYGYRMPWAQDRLYGTFPLSSRMDTVGWLASNVADVRLMLRLSDLEAPEKSEHLAAESSLQSRTTSDKSRTAPAGEIKIAAVVPPDVSLETEVRHRWNEALALLSEVDGISAKAIDPPGFLGTEAWKAYNVIGSSDAASVHREWLDRYQSLYDPTVWSLIDRGRRWSDERITAAEGTQERVTQYLHGLLTEFDIVVMPVTPQASPTFVTADGTFREAVLRLNAPVSLAGLGALTVPIAHDAVASSGMQLVIPVGGEGRLLKLFTRLGW